jgi:dihydroorotate dehydrogenase electron transfer subunit
MRTYQGRVAEVQLRLGEALALISCPSEAVPAAGQYLLAVQTGAIQATSLFIADGWSQGFLAAQPYPRSWRPGTELSLYGPLGRGFRLPAATRRLALIALGDSNARLMPLVSSSESEGWSATLFSDAPLGELPPDLEAYPLKDLGESLSWADFFALDVPLERLDALAEHFSDYSQSLAEEHGQVLVHTSMPCSGMGECGVCAVRVKRSWKLACRDGPVFDLRAILKGVSW